MKRSPMPRSNPKRRREKLDRNYGDRADAVRDMMCVVAGEVVLHGRMLGIPCRGHVQACHARARGMGGAKGDRRDLWPGCDTHHAEAGEMPQMGRWEGTQRAQFERRYGISITGSAAAIAIALDGRGFK